MLVKTPTCDVLVAPIDYERMLEWAKGYALAVDGIAYLPKVVPHPWATNHIAYLFVDEQYVGAYKVEDLAC